MHGRDQASPSSKGVYSISACSWHSIANQVWRKAHVVSEVITMKEFAVHVRGARNNGLSELEIREAIIHATTYCGVPAGVDAMKTAEKVFNEMAEKGEAQRELGNKSEKA